MSTRYGSLVSPKIAGIESNANSRSVAPRATRTTNIGVISRRPPSTTVSFTPWYSCVAGKHRCTRRRISGGWNSSSSPASPSRPTFQAVYTRNAPNR